MSSLAIIGTAHVSS
jgi:hypothetical protein